MPSIFSYRSTTILLNDLSKTISIISTVSNTIRFNNRVRHLTDELNKRTLTKNQKQMFNRLNVRYLWI